MTATRKTDAAAELAAAPLFTLEASASQESRCDW
jgi:hypothetical protein